MDFKKQYNIDDILVIVFPLLVLWMILGKFQNALIAFGIIWLVIRFIVNFPLFSIVLLLLGLSHCGG